MILFLPAICLLACGLTLFFEAKGMDRLTVKAKLLASLAFVGFAWDQGAKDSVYGWWILTGLGLSLVGDVLLAMKGHSRWFLLGIGAFLLAHLAYAAAFIIIGIDTASLPWVVPWVLVFLLITTGWLKRHLSGVMQFAVPAYLLAIGLMLVLACSNHSPMAGGWIIIGASLFALSDLFVARQRFIQADPRNRLLGLPIYYLAQLLLAYTVALV
ncbi:lysoplasmalogenase [Marinicella meishanensis]|uniref:lysoplasmalogenase n=1 Tax=Marinicella meishanensis TaxID=2873263 RepID=UPI001CBF33E3|nr:lysoplasmalogenase [Marinicella sp. NBU2979]